MRIKLMQLIPSLESYSTDDLGEGWKDALFALVENGPMPADEVGGQAAVDSLKNDGYVSDIYVSDGTWKPGVTKKGVELYCQVVGEDTVEKAIAKRKEWLAEDKGQAEEAIDHAEVKAEDEAQDAVHTAEKVDELKEVAQENFVDSFTNLNGEPVQQ